MRSWLAGGPSANVRQLLLGAVVLAIVAALLGWWLSRPATVARAASGPGSYVIGMHDYSFSPSHLTWHVGEQVTLTFINDSDPGTNHEFMMGHDPRRYATMLGPRQEDGFFHDFFTGITVWFGDAQGVDMLMPGKAYVTGMEASRYYMRMPMSSMNDSSAAMSSSPSPSPAMSMESGDSMGATPSPSPVMSMSGGDSMSSMSPSASPSPATSMDSGSMDSGSMDSGSMDSGSMDSGSSSMIMKGNGLMIDLDPGGQATIRFTVPDRPGTWTFGCFDQSGQHFLNGMRGTVTIIG